MPRLSAIPPSPLHRLPTGNRHLSHSNTRPFVWALRAADRLSDDAYRAALEQNNDSSVTERFKPDFKLVPNDKRLVRWGRPNPTAHSTVLAANFPERRNRQDVLVSDVDGVVTDMVVGSAFFEFAAAAGALRAATKTRLAVPFATYNLRKDFVGYHSLGASIFAGLKEERIRELGELFFQHVVLHPEFNMEPSPSTINGAPGKLRRPGPMLAHPFLYREAIEDMLRRHERGGINILASGSSAYPLEAIFQPENLWHYANVYLDLDVPSDEPIVHFILGSRPTMSKGVATVLPETPLTIGLGKALNVTALLQRWNIDPATVTFRTDDICNDGPTLVRIGNRDTNVIVNPPVDQVGWAAQLGHQVQRYDFQRPQFADLESQRIHEEARKAYRFELIKEIVAQLLRKGKI